MPNQNMLPNVTPVLASTTSTQTATSAVLTLPLADSYRLILAVSAASGTTPTLDVSIATSFDGGTTYAEVLQFDQLTTTGAKQLVFRPALGSTEVASHGTVGLLGTTDLATNTAVVANGPIDPRFIKIRWQISGTTPSFTFSVAAIASPVGRSSF